MLAGSAWVIDNGLVWAPSLRWAMEGAKAFLLRSSQLIHVETTRVSSPQLVSSFASSTDPKSGCGSLVVARRS